MYEISLVQQCRLLEQHFDTNYLGVCLENSTDAARAIQEAKFVILRKDWNCTVREARTHPSLTIVCPTDFITASWNSTWDQALEFGVRGTRLMQTLFNSLSRPFWETNAALTVRILSPHPTKNIYSQAI